MSSHFLDACDQPLTLVNIVNILLEYKHEPFDLDFNLHSSDVQLGAYRHLHLQLRQRGYWKLPKVLISDEIQIPDRRKQLSQLILTLGGTIASSDVEDDIKSATHCIVPNQTDYIRPANDKQETDDYLKIHRWTSPNSLDHFLPKCQLLPAKGTKHQQISHVKLKNANIILVTENWLLDSEKFNEWMNETDYDPETTLDPIINKGPYYYYPSSTSCPQPSKKRLSESPPPSKDAKKKINDHIIRNIQMGLFNSSDNPKETSHDNSLRKKLSLDHISPTLAFPHHSTWFSMNSIHENEKLALPEFFVPNCLARSTNKTPEIYREYRDFMIYTYQQNPSQYLTFTACRRSLAGDVCSLIRVHDFLEHVGLINYAVNPTELQTNLSSSLPKPNVTHDNQVFNPPPNHTDTLCSNCLKPISHLCSTCTQDFSNTNWSHQETLRLLDALDLYGEDWPKISQHVGSKTIDDCILHFLSLPINDDLPSSINDDHQTSPNATKHHLLSNSNHPVLSLLNFIKESIPHHVASSSIQAALHSLLESFNQEPTSPVKHVNTQPLPSLWSKIQASSLASLALSSFKASLLFEKEEREIQQHVHQLIAMQFQKLELKLKQFDELKCILDAERAKIEDAQKQLYAERQRFLEEMK
ncbi:SWI/SNF complex subunit SMARCC1-like isoform X2 [Schistocerca gregaria]|uniref:SWI/SNF complex subunit SMARCC1-like isoform X2 n=1 Tax=Schistocerca gregaria TaxID=7010 RepID=UPI00211EA11B|nr:SWI/SNF complex subunit SMARCC1-like isoform X2 [Schistocerca gregaria]